MKLRLLNGSHSTLAYLGFLLGHEYIWQASADPLLAALVERQMAEEIAPTLVAPPGVDLAAYGAKLMERFRNPALPHRTRQIAMDGSQKLPQRLLGTIRDRLAPGRPDRAISRWRSRGGSATPSGTRRARRRRSTCRTRWRREFRRSSRRRRATPGPVADGFLDLAACSAPTWSRTTRFARRCAHNVVALFRDGARRRSRGIWRGAHERRAPDVARSPVADRRTMFAAFAAARVHSSRLSPLWRSESTAMTIRSNLHPDRLFPVRPGHARRRAPPLRDRGDLPIVSPHGHTDPQWYADDTPFPNASALFITPDHYVFRMLYSQGVRARGPRHPAARGREAPWKPTRARSGARSPRTSSCSAARRRACGSTTRSTTASASASG